MGFGTWLNFTILIITFIAGFSTGIIVDYLFFARKNRILPDEPEPQPEPVEQPLINDPILGIVYKPDDE